MPIVSQVRNVAAGATDPNVISGSAYELPDKNYWGRLLMTADAAGATRVTVQVGSRIHMEEGSVSRGNRIPIFPDDLLLDKFPCPKGQRIVIKSRNPSGAAIDNFVNLTLTPA